MNQVAIMQKTFTVLNCIAYTFLAGGLKLLRKS